MDEVMGSMSIGGKWLVFILATLAVIACSGNGSKRDSRINASPRDGTHLADTTSDGHRPAAKDARVKDGRITPSVICDDYLSCLSAAQPEAFPPALLVYKVDGPCWASSAAAARCEKACQTGYDKLAEAHPTVIECGGTIPSCGRGIYPSGPYGFRAGDTARNLEFQGFSDPQNHCKAHRLREDFRAYTALSAAGIEWRA